MNKKFILYIGGGAMAGVFSAGIITELQKLNIYNKIEAVYAASAGVINAAYFLTKQTTIGSSIYYENLTNNFILPKNALTRITIKKNKDIVNINYLIEIMKNDKKLNLNKLKKQKIPFWGKVINLSTNKIEYININKHPTLKSLKATVDLLPYTVEKEKIGKSYYADGGSVEDIGLDYLLKKYPKQKIIIIINYSPKRKLRHYIKNFLEGIFSIPIYNIKIFKMILHREKKFRKDIKLSIETERVLLIHPPENNVPMPSCTDKNKLIHSFKLGKKEAKKIVNFIK